MDSEIAGIVHRAARVGLLGHADEVENYGDAQAGVAVLPRAPHHDPALVEIALRDPAAYRHVRAVWHKDRRLTPAARRFTKFLTTSGVKVLGGG
jgi:DNA-binding transcriptional LysR family regulator